MTLVREITEAIKAHGEWKLRLRSAIVTGKSDFPVSLACQDNRCALGRWLLSQNASTKASTRWKCVRTAHADFHKEAGRILEMALEGKQDEASAALLYPSKYTGLSTQLTMELTMWKRDQVQDYPTSRLVVSA